MIKIFERRHKGRGRPRKAFIEKKKTARQADCNRYVDMKI